MYLQKMSEQFSSGMLHNTKMNKITFFPSLFNQKGGWLIFENSINGSFKCSVLFPGSPESSMLRRESDSYLNMDWAVL